MKFCPACNNHYDDNLSFCPKDGEVLEEDPSSFVGSVLDGQYQIEALLGKGGMGAVYRARHILLGDRVAIKLLPPEMRSNTEWLRRFQREGQAARRFRHPNAVTVYDLRTSGDGTIYLVMEYVEGTTLDVELKRHGRFAPAEALAMLRPVMSVLNAAHAMGVVHRDLKPENIMIGKAGTSGEPVVKLLDLGIAKLREVAGVEKTGSTALTMAGQMLGTPYYMSPEQWGELPDDGSSEIDGRADIYSLGVVLYELVAGKRPFSGLTILELRKQHVTETPKPLREVVPGVSESFSRAIARSIAKDRSQRQSTAAELEAELGAALSDDGSSSAVFPEIGSEQDRTTGLATRAERATPTIGDSGAQTMVESAAAPAASQAATIPTLVVSTDELAAREGARPQESPQVISKPQMEIAVPSRRQTPLIIGAVVIVLLIVLGVGGYAITSYLKGRPTTNPAVTTADPDLSAPKHEVARYWLEVESTTDSLRAGDPVELQSGQRFKFHFSPSQSGYLYLIGPGANNAPAVFLSAQPTAGSGLKTNQVSSGVDFSFPADTGRKANFIRLNNTPGTDEFTFVFSPSPITTPGFFAGASERYLTADELKQWEDFQEQARVNAASTEVIKAGASPQVAVKVPQNAPENASVVFKVSIQHR
ncbi:MAG TPA: protein kinase [Pyrinomonadaceae bacterium]|nr:protein kinase [Pyrinomonadaceae bacterium]